MPECNVGTCNGPSVVLTHRGFTGPVGLGDAELNTGPVELGDAELNTGPVGLGNAAGPWEDAEGWRSTRKDGVQDEWEEVKNDAVGACFHCSRTWRLRVSGKVEIPETLRG